MFRIIISNYKNNVSNYMLFVNYFIDKMHI